MRERRGSGCGNEGVGNLNVGDQAIRDSQAKAACVVAELVSERG
jgi:hypothetical protein